MQYGIQSCDGSASTSRSVTSTANGSHNFVIEGYSLVKGIGVGRRFSSQTFFAGGYQWAIYFYPDGISSHDKSRYVSVFIGLASKGTNVRASLVLTLVDQSGEGNDISLYSHARPRGERGPHIFYVQGSLWGYNRFIERAALEISNYLKDDCVILHCTVGVVVSANEYGGLHSIAVPESELGLNFGKLLENQEATDVTFDVAGEKFRAHKLVLAARSPVFRSIFFASSEQNNEVLITEMEPRVFKAMLHYIYTETLLDEEPSPANSSSSSTTGTLTERLLAVADAYGLRRLRLLCESKLCRNISVNTVASTLALAESCHATGLKAACLKFSTQNLPEVMRSKGFECLQQKYPLLVSKLLKAVVGFEDDCSSREAVVGFEDDCSSREAVVGFEDDCSSREAVVGFEDDCSSRENRRRVCDQPSDATDINGRRVRPRNSIQSLDFSVECDYESNDTVED